MTAVVDLDERPALELRVPGDRHRETAVDRHAERARRHRQVPVDGHVAGHGHADAARSSRSRRSRRSFPSADAAAAEAPTKRSSPPPAMEPFTADGPRGVELEAWRDRQRRSCVHGQAAARGTRDSGRRRAVRSPGGDDRVDRCELGTPPLQLPGRRPARADCSGPGGLAAQCGRTEKQNENENESQVMAVNTAHGRPSAALGGTAVTGENRRRAGVEQKIRRG